MHPHLFKSIIASFLFLFFSSAANSQCSFGNENPGFPGPSSYGANYLLGVKYNCPNPMTIDALHLYGLGTNSNVQMAIYEDNMGVPGNLLAASALGVVGTGDISLAIPPTNLTAGDYWIMAIYDNINGLDGHTNYTTTTTKTVYYTSLPFGNPMPTNANGFTSYCCQDFQYWATGSAHSTDTRFECAPFTWIDGNTYTADTNAVSYTYIGGSAQGCDSIVTLDLTIQPVDVSTSVNELTITANLSGAVYQWIDCDNANALLQGENNQSYTATMNGNYACIIDDNGCIDTTACVAITTVGTENIHPSAFRIYPNPAHDQLFVEGDFSTLQYEIMDLNGRMLIHGTGNSIAIASLATGSYVLKLTSGEMVTTHRWNKN